MTRIATALAFLAFLGPATASEPIPDEALRIAPGLPDYGAVETRDLSSRRGGPGPHQGHNTLSQAPAKDRAESRAMGTEWLKKIQQANGLLWLDTKKFPFGIDPVGTKCVVKGFLNLVHVRHPCGVGALKRQGHACCVEVV